jgi:DNA-directed RNA polymerase subunit beta
MSETTTLIPFLEHDDATRAEMGTNMMRQAVPLIRAEAPVVGTGMERVIGEGSGYVVKALDDGEIIGVDAKHISVLYKNGKKVTYPLRTFERSNHDMLIHQWARVRTGDKITKGSDSRWWSINWQWRTCRWSQSPCCVYAMGRI